MNAEIGVVALEPLHCLAVGGKAVLDEQVLTNAHDVSCVPHGLNFGGHEVLVSGTNEALLDGDALIVVVVLVGLVGQTRTGSLGPQELGVFLEVLVHERPVGQVLEVAATEGVCRGDDFVTHREQDVTRRHLGEAGLGAEVGSLDLLVPLQRSRAVNLDAEAFEDLDVVVKLLVSCLNGGGGTGSPHAAHLGVNRNLLGGCGLFGRNYGEVCTTNDNVLQRIEIIPGIDDLRHFVSLPCECVVSISPNFFEGWRRKPLSKQLPTKVGDLQVGGFSRPSSVPRRSLVPEGTVALGSASPSGGVWSVRGKRKCY